MNLILSVLGEKNKKTRNNFLYSFQVLTATGVKSHGIGEPEKYRCKIQKEQFPSPPLGVLFPCTWFQQSLTRSIREFTQKTCDCFS